MNFNMMMSLQPASETQMVLLLVRLVLELVLSAGPGPAVAADVLRAL